MEVCINPGQSVLGFLGCHGTTQWVLNIRRSFLWYETETAPCSGIHLTQLILVAHFGLQRNLMFPSWSSWDLKWSLQSNARRVSRIIRIPVLLKKQYSKINAKSYATPWYTQLISASSRKIFLLGFPCFCFFGHCWWNSLTPKRWFHSGNPRGWCS